MNAEFVDTNVLIYTYDDKAGSKRAVAADLVLALGTEDRGAISTQVLMEFYSVITRKLKQPTELAEAIISDLADWRIHRPTHTDILKAIALQRKYKLSWWDAMIVQSALETGCTTLWSEDMADRQRIGTLRIRNPFT